MDDVVFNTSNCFWISGIIFLLAGSLYKSCRIITKEDAEAKVLVRIIEKYRPSTISVAAFVIPALLQIPNLKPMDSIKCLAIGGTPLSASIGVEFKKFIPNGKISLHYGCTELNGVITDSVDRLDSVGQLSHNVEMKVIPSKWSKILF